MIKGEVFTIEKTLNAGTGYTYAPVGITGHIAYLGCEVQYLGEDGMCGAPQVMQFTFQALECGDASIQFAYYRTFDLSDIIYEDVLPIKVESHAILNCSRDLSPDLGAWSKFENPSPEDLVVFNRAMASWRGVSYTPLKVSKQVINGMNYRFICDAMPATLDPVGYKAMVYIYNQAGAEAPVITHIEPNKQ